jgi:hypothetical protein
MGPGKSQALYNILKQNEVITDTNPPHIPPCMTICLVLHVGLFLADRPPPPPPFSHTNEHWLVQESLEHNLKTAPDRKNMLLVVRQQLRYETLISYMRWNKATQSAQANETHASSVTG